MNGRKVIQIAIAATHQPYALEPLQMLYALCDENETPIGAVIECECPRCRQRFTLTDWFYVPISVSEDAPDGE